MHDRASLDEIVEIVRRELQELEGSFSSRGLRVVDLALDTANRRSFPDLLVSLDCEDVEGLRLRGCYLGTRGVLEDPAEVARGLYIWSQEVTPAGLAALPRAVPIADDNARSRP